MNLFNRNNVNEGMAESHALVYFQASFFLFLAMIFLGKGCEEKEEIPKDFLPNYDGYLIDLPQDRTLYHSLNVKERIKQEFQLLDLSTQQNPIVRRDSFDTKGKLLKTTFVNHSFLDSIRYSYMENGHIQKIERFTFEDEMRYSIFEYDENNVLKRSVIKRSALMAHDYTHDLNGILTDKRISDESPTHSNVRETLKFDGNQNWTHRRILRNDVMMAVERRHYEPRTRHLILAEYFNNGVLTEKTNFSYQENFLLAIQKDARRNDDKSFSEKVYEFTYEYYENKNP